MKKYILTLCLFLSLFFSFDYTINLLATEIPSELYAKSAILMDGSNQRVLFGKEENTPLPMASTTKIMTCLYALEHGQLSDVVTISSNAAVAPKVHLGVSSGQQFLLSDLLYALMLESYNDAAVAIAEHISGSVEAFCRAMTEEARNFGCYHTSFETPNGLDSDNHFTTAKDLAILTCRALENDAFRSIISEPSYSIRELTTGRIWNLQNKNAFLSSYPGAIGVKTGFTGDAGYCFVGAVETPERLLISVVLGSGWPPNRGYKWKDTRKLMDYGQENFHPATVSPSDGLPAQLPVIHGQAKICELLLPEDVSLLLSESEQVTFSHNLPTQLEAPVHKNDCIGTVTLFIDGKIHRKYPVYAAASVESIRYPWCFQKMMKAFFFR